jgi:parvulin-like peptidyl-prolyl isomerase
MKTLLLLAIGAIAQAAVVDRVAVVVGNHVITESEVNDELRVTAFLNGQPVDLSPAKRREAAERMVDQELIRGEMNLSHYEMPPASEADALLANFKRERYPSDAQYRAALAKYGITDDQVKHALAWEDAVIRFTDERFSPALPLPPADNVQTANRLRAGAEEPAGEKVDQLLDQWLKQARGTTRIVLRPEAFQ